MNPRRRLQHIIDECEQIIRDVQHWNSINPTWTPIDTEAERVVLSKAKVAARDWDEGRHDDACRIIGDLVDYAEVVIDEERRRR